MQTVFLLWFFLPDFSCFFPQKNFFIFANILERHEFHAKMFFLISNEEEVIFVHVTVSTTLSIEGKDNHLLQPKTNPSIVVQDQVN